jgi:hypothetical protein
MQSVATGKIEGNHLSFSSLFDKPLEIEEVSLNAKENHITVDRANFAWGGKRFALSGDVRCSDARVILDVSLSTESIDIDELKDLRPQKKEEGEKQGGLGFTLEGVIRFKSNALKYEGFIWEPFQANITFGQHGVEITIEEAKLCGISTPGVVKMMGQELSFDIQPFFRSREFGPTAKCLLDEEVRATGDFELKGRIVAQGKPEDLFDSFKGDLEFRAKAGQINYSVGLFRILEFINITEMYRGKLPDMKKEGLPYKLISARGSFQNGRFIMKDVTLDGPTMEMVAQGEIDLRNQQINFTVLVAPLKTVDRIIKVTPLAREILAGTLVTIPLAVQGNFKDPRVTLLSPSAIGSELLAMMQRTLGIPFKVIESLTLRKGEESGEER